MELQINNDLATQGDIQNWIGKIFKTNRCGNIKVLGIHYKNKGHTWFICEFQDGYRVSACKDNIKKGKVNNPYEKLYFNVGYIGNVDKPSKHPLYNMWTDMLGRCYGDKYKFYQNISVAKEWHSFENFINTIKHVLGYKEYIKYKNDIRFCLDKDIIGRKTKYSINNCCFIPHKLNTFIGEQKKCNTSGYRGVSWDKNRQKWMAQYGGGNNTNKHLGRFDTKEEAYAISKEYRINVLNNLLNTDLKWIDIKIKYLCLEYFKSII